MTAKPRKPLLLNLTWASVACSVMVGLYVAAYLGWITLYAYGMIDSDTCLAGEHTFFRPIIWYYHSDMPGAEAGGRLLDWCCEHILDAPDSP
jgi:hypothetical protein